MAPPPESDAGTDGPDRDDPVAGVIHPIGNRRAVFLPDAEAPTVDRAAIQNLLARGPMRPEEQQRLIYLVSHYRAWYTAMREVLDETARRELESGDHP